MSVIVVMVAYVPVMATETEVLADESADRREHF